MPDFLKTAGAARQLGVSYTKLFNLIRCGRLVAPAKDSSGDYIWVEADLRRARQAIEDLHRPRRMVVSA